MEKPATEHSSYENNSEDIKTIAFYLYEAIKRKFDQEQLKKGA